MAKECLEIGMEAAKPFCFVGDIGNAIQKHAHKNGFSVVRDLCGHGVGLEFHEEPDVEHYGKKGTGMLACTGYGVHHRADDQHGNVGGIY